MPRLGVTGVTRCEMIAMRFLPEQSASWVGISLSYSFFWSCNYEITFSGPQGKSLSYLHLLIHPVLFKLAAVDSIICREESRLIHYSNTPSLPLLAYYYCYRKVQVQQN